MLEVQQIPPGEIHLWNTTMDPFISVWILTLKALESNRVAEVHTSQNLLNLAVREPSRDCNCWGYSCSEEHTLAVPRWADMFG